MKTREEAARFAERILSWDYDLPEPLSKHDKVHTGRQEVRALLDFIYDGPPENEDQQVLKRRLTPF